METLEVEQTYDLASLTVLCRAARKKIHRWMFVLRIVCWIILASGAALCALLAALGGMPEPWMIVVLVLLLALMLLEDRLNAWIALRSMVPGTAHSVTAFTDEVYTVTTDTTETKYRYENITGLCETERYFVLFLGDRHGQVFDKRGLRFGTPDDLRALLARRTGLPVQMVQ